LKATGSGIFEQAKRDGADIEEQAQEATGQCRSRPWLYLLVGLHGLNRLTIIILINQPRVCFPNKSRSGLFPLMRVCKWWYGL